jgi:hypothetical protein
VGALDGLLELGLCASSGVAVVRWLNGATSQVAYWSAAITISARAACPFAAA